MTYFRFVLYTLFMLSVDMHNVQAQFDLPGRGTSSGSGATFEQTEFEQDTLNVRYYYQTAPEISYIFDDTLISHFHEFDLTDIDGTIYQNLGFPGSAVIPLIRIPNTFTGFSLGLDSYRPYYVDDHNFKFYNSKKAITKVFFTKGKTQNDGLLSAQFGRSFKDRIQFSLDFNRYNNFGIYSRQAGRNTHMGVGMTYRSEDGRFLLFGTHYSNIIDQQNNGGITTDTLFTAAFSEERTNIPTYLLGASTRDQFKVYQIHARYRLLGKDSVNANSGLLLKYIFRADNRKFKFSDTDLSEESIGYYDSLLTDDRGIRHFVGHQRIINDFSLNVGNQPDRQIRAGLRSIINKINQEPEKQTITEWKAYGNVRWDFADRLKLEALGELNINRENASFLAAGLLTANLGKVGVFSGLWRINQQRPSLIQRRLYINQIEVWDNDLKNIFVNELKASYKIPDFNFEVTGGQVLSNNNIYFNQRGYPTQQDGLSSLLYLSVFKSFKVGSLANENRIVLQRGSDNPVFRAPNWYSQHSLDISGIIFKKVLDFRTGFDLRLNNPYRGYSFLPVIGQFAVEDNLDIPFYPSVDFRSSFRVRYFRAFVILHNILQPLRSDVYYQTGRYPQPDFFFRLGIGWIFIN